MTIINQAIADKINSILVPLFGLEQVTENPTFNKYRLIETESIPLSSCRYLYSFQIEILLSSLKDTDYLVFGIDSVTGLLLQNGFSVEWNRQEIEEQIEGKTGFMVTFNCKTFI